MEAVIDHNLLKSRRKSVATILEFRVKWKGGYEDSWHEFADFEHSVASVEAYPRNMCTPRVRRANYKGLRPEELLMLSADLRAEATRS